MYNELKKEIKDIIDIVNQCPEALQEKCFEILLDNYLCSNNTDLTQKKFTSKDNLINITPISMPSEAEQDTLSDGDEEITINDFHVKIQRFLQSNGISISIINKLYYKEDNKIMPLYDTLNSVKMSECQLRLALLTAFENAYNNNSGELTFNGEIVRNRCQDMKCYDMPNFASNFKNNSRHFDNWDGKYNKNVEYTLSVEGKKQLADTLKELSKGQL